MEMESIVAKLTETEARSRSNTKRIDKMEERQDNLEQLTAAVAVMQKEQENVVADVGEIKADVKEIKDKPRKWWESVIVAVIGAVAGYIVAAVMKGGV